MVQPMEMVLRNHHVTAIPEADRLVLLMRACGHSVATISVLIHLSESSVRRAIARSQARIFLPLGLEGDGWATALWVGFHLDCCLRADSAAFGQPPPGRWNAGHPAPRARRPLRRLA